MKKLFFVLILVCCVALSFAQNVKPYTADLNSFPATNGDKTASFNKTTKTITIKQNQPGTENGIYLDLKYLDISDYNIVRFKYTVPTDYGFYFILNYDDNSNLAWNEYCTYCPGYLTEMVIPLSPEKKRLNGIELKNLWNISCQQIILEAITLEKVSNPQKTDVFASDEPPVIDIATSGTINEKLTAWDFVQKLGAGFQYMCFTCGTNSLDMGMDIYSWTGFSKPTKEQILFLKEKGFKTIRLQTSPGLGHILDENYTIDPRYINEIKKVIDWCIEEDLYVILCGAFAEDTGGNEFKRRVEIGDKHFADYYVNEKYKKESKKFIEAMWRQYAQAFNNSYDEHLIFETLNEPVDMLHEHAWQPQNNCSGCKKSFAILNEYNQLIVDTIRSTGGNNATRFVMIEGLGARWYTITSNLFKLPKDKAKDKLIPTYHHYPMGGAEEYSNKYYTDGIKETITESFAALDKKYFSKHIPVYLGETSQSRHTLILERIKMMKDIMAEVTKAGRSCAACFHSDGDLTGYSSPFFGYYDCWELKWYDEEFVDTFVYGASGKEYKLSDDFVKKNTVKIESIVGKELLQGPYEIKSWNAYRMKSSTFYDSTPAKYKLVIELEKTGSDPRLELAYIDFNGVWHNSANTPLLQSLKVKGGAYDGNVLVNSDTVEITINEKLAKVLPNCDSVYLNGQNIILKSVKVVE
ncbi:MAG: glycoside hydrolase family 5 protein [Treponema sp.]|nr:glycoside hydrolase family 5 protein [Treponema sp.]